MGDDDGVDILASENLFVVACCKDIAAPEFFASFETAVVAICYGHQLRAGNLHCELCVGLTLDASSDERELYVIVWRYLRSFYFSSKRIDLWTPATSARLLFRLPSGNFYDSTIADPRIMKLTTICNDILLS